MSRKSADFFGGTESVGWPKVTRVPIPLSKSRSVPSSPSPRRSGSTEFQFSSPSSPNPLAEVVPTEKLSPSGRGLPPWILARKGRSNQKVQSAHVPVTTSPGGTGLPPWARKYVAGNQGDGKQDDRQRLMGWDEVQARQMPPKRRYASPPSAPMLQLKVPNSAKQPTHTLRKPN